MKRVMTMAFAATLTAATLIAAPAFAEGGRVGVEPFLGTLGDSQTLTDGKDIYTYWCAACHAPGKPGSVAVMMLHEEKMPKDLADNDNLDAEYVRYMVRNGQAAMPFFRKTQISDSQLDALAEYLSASKK